MREPHNFSAAIESVLTGSLQSTYRNVKPAAKQQGREIAPEWPGEQLRLLFDSVANEPLPEAFVRLLRQLNEVEGIQERR